jgi:hypothetical protein
MRHTVIQEAFRQSARSAAIITSAGFKSSYDVQSRQEVPDLIVFDGAERPTVIDFSVTHQGPSLEKEKRNAAKVREAVKFKAYKTWNTATANAVPLVMTRFTFSEAATKVIKDIARNTGRTNFVMEANGADENCAHQLRSVPRPTHERTSRAASSDERSSCRRRAVTTPLPLFYCIQSSAPACTAEIPP